MHKCKVNNKVYIGITNNTERRWRTGGIEYKPHKDENQNRPFWNAIKKYGWENFENIILEQGLTFDEAIEVEKGYIDLYDSTNRRYGYNVSKGGNGGLIYEVHPRGMKGKSQTEYQINSHREWASQKENNCMTNGRVIWGVTHPHPKGMKGKTHSDEYKMKLKKMMRGKNNHNSKKVRVEHDGKIYYFDSLGECSRYFNYNYHFFWRLAQSGKPYVIKPNNSKKHMTKHFEGMKVKYVSEDTEVKHTLKSVAHRNA